MNKNNLLKILLLMVICGIFGFIYETIFYRIDLGYFVKRGDTLGPWLPIYAFGGLFIYLITKKYKKNIPMIFILSLLTAGLLEYITGYVLLEFFNLRLWDYNNEILNFGNINGFICFRSVLFFGLSGILLIKIIVPMLDKFEEKVSQKTLTISSIVPSLLFLIDVLTHNLVNLFK